MQPLLNLGLLCALACLRHARFGWAGVALGLALAVKLWALVPLVIVALWLLGGCGRRSALRYLGGASAAIVVAVVPFFLIAPGQFISQVISFQSGRPRSSTGTAERIFYFSGSILGYDRVPAVAWWIAGIVGLLIASLPLLRYAAASRRGRWTEPMLWSALFLAQFLTIVLAPSFFDNYAAFTGPALALLVGYAVGLVAGHASAVGRRVVLSATALVMIALAVMSVRNSGQREPTPDFGEALAGYRCVWAHDPHTMLEAGRSGDQAAQRCAMFVDRYAVSVRELNVPDEQVLAALPGADGYQAAVRDERCARSRPGWVRCSHDTSTSCRGHAADDTPGVGRDLS